MSLVPGLVLLQGQPSEPSPFGMLVPMAAIFLIFFFLVIRPQQKKQKEHEEMLKAIDKGDNVITSGGLHGKVTGVADDVLTIEIGNIKGERIRVRVARGKIDHVSKDKGDAS